MSTSTSVKQPEVSNLPATTADAKSVGETGIHRIVPEIAIGAALWFILMAWLDFARGGEIDYLLVIVTLFFAMFFALFLLTASYSEHDQRWPLRDTSLREFLRSKISTATGTMRVRHALIEIALVPVSLAFAATVIGFVWSAIH